MKVLGWELRRAEPIVEYKAQFDDVLAQLTAAQSGRLGAIVTPDTCMQSPTVHAIVTAISRRISVSPVHVYRKTTKDGRDSKEKLPSHPVAKLLARPNSFQTRTDYWLDAASWYVRYGNFYAYKSRGSTGPIRELLPMVPRCVTPKQNPDTWAVTYRWTAEGGGTQEYGRSQVHHVRGPARNGFLGDSPIKDVEQAIALEILAEKFGANFFNNGALPLLVFSFLSGNKGFKTPEEEKQFINDFQNALGGSRAFRSFLTPAGMDKPTPVPIENDKAQFLETRKYQRTVIAGALGVPPHLVGDLERATFNNVEQQDADFTLNVVMPIAQSFESAMERDLLTDEDRAGGIIIRFNLDSTLRADFKSRQEGLQIQRLNGVTDADEWREIEGKNPLPPKKGGEDVWRPGNMLVAGEPLPEPPAPKTEEPKFVINLPAHIVNLTNKLGVDVGVEPQSIRVGDTTVSVNPADVSINVPTHVAPPNVTVEPTHVTVNTPDVTVNNEPAEINITNDVKSPDVHVAPTQVNVPAPQINVESPSVTVHNDVKTPEVTIEQAQVHVTNKVDVPYVNVKNTVEAPIVNVPAANVNVAAPAVTIKNELPEYQVIEQEIERDEKGRLSKTITKRKRKG